MLISEIHIYQKDLPVVGAPYTMARSSLAEMDSTIVRVVTDCGLTGWGETCPVGPVYQPHHARGARAGLEEMAPQLIGANALDIDLARTVMDDTLNGHNYAKAALDIAWWDLQGKHYGEAVCRLLGGARTDRVPSYYATGIDTPDETAKLALEKMRQGFTRLQIKAGGRDISIDIETIHKVWETVGFKVRLKVDANRSWTSRDALLISSACRDIPVVLEQPCNSIEEVASIRPQLCHPVYLDESILDVSTLLRAISLGVCDGFGLKVTRLGGLSAMRTVRDICAARMLPHSMDDAFGGDIIAAACVHMGATVQPHLLEGVWIAAPYLGDHYDQEDGIDVEEGHIRVPVGPGLGVNPHEDRVGTLVGSFD